MGRELRVGVGRHGPVTRLSNDDASFVTNWSFGRVTARVARQRSASEEMLRERDI